MRTSTVKRALVQASGFLDRRFSWDRLPLPGALAVLVGIRESLRANNLYDTGDLPDAPDAARPVSAPSSVEPVPPRYLVARSPDGSCNDLAAPRMGMAGTRFGRNVPLDRTGAEEPPALLTPNPRVVSTELLARREFLPAQTLNVLAASWLQFETRDWFSHGTDPSRPIELPRPEGDDWPEETIRLPRTPADPTAAPDGRPATFLNTETHWWDASQVYGSSLKFQEAIRTGSQGRVAIGSDGLIDLDPSLLGKSGGIDGWWFGLELLHTLFMREHNAICERLHAAYPSWSDDQRFDKARLVNAALIAKIHTVEWTTAILGHPALRIGMRANWFGLAEERIRRAFGRVSGSEVFSGIPGSSTDHHTAPYSITEEFVAVYRMHPLIPDDYLLRSAGNGAVRQELAFLEGAGLRARPLLERHGAGDLFYSLGTAHPGAVTLHNHPRFLQQFRRDDGMLIDLAAVDILRSRERGVPRYTEFRRLLHMRVPETFEQLTRNRERVEEIRSIYGSVDEVDLTVGMYAEDLPAGFGFSDTAFRIFVLMASRRLKSDRFFTVDFTPRVYTPEGMAWIDGNDMSSVLLRHYPDLAPALRNVRNAFAPWNTT